MNPKLYMQTKLKRKGNLRHTVGPASKEVPESAMAAQPPAQKPDNDTDAGFSILFKHN
jgi:hypothetical protein